MRRRYRLAMTALFAGYFASLAAVVLIAAGWFEFGPAAQIGLLVVVFAALLAAGRLWSTRRRAIHQGWEAGYRAAVADHFSARGPAPGAGEPDEPAGTPPP